MPQESIAINQSSIQGDTISDATKSFVATISNLPPLTSGSSSMKDIARQYLFAAEVEEVKAIRRERGHVLPFGPGIYPKENREGTPISELGLSKSTLKKLGAAFVIWYEDPKEKSRMTWFSRGIETVETMKVLAERELIFVLKLSGDEMYTICQRISRPRPISFDELPWNDRNPKIAIVSENSLLMSHDLSCKEDKEYVRYGRRYKAKEILGEDIALIPGLHAETVAILKSFDVFDLKAKRCRQVQTIGDFVQLDFGNAIERNQLKGNLITVANFLASYGLFCDEYRSNAIRSLGAAIVFPLRDTVESPLDLERIAFEKYGLQPEKARGKVLGMHYDWHR
jgi:hypothetical protein